MPGTHTINSKLRVLIAKTYQAEKLFLSMKSSGSAGFENKKLIELANNVRAEVWGSIHSDLRKSLNTIVGTDSQANIIAEVNKLKNSFLSVIDEKNRQLEKTTQILFEMGTRGEFFHTLKSSLELVRLKAAIQANHTIVEQLSSIIGVSSANHKSLPEISSEDFDESIDDDSFSNVHVLSFNRRAV